MPVHWVKAFSLFILFNISSYNAVWAKNQTNHLLKNEWISYVKRYIDRGLNLIIREVFFQFKNILWVSLLDRKKGRENLLRGRKKKESIREDRDSIIILHAFPPQINNNYKEDFTHNIYGWDLFIIHCHLPYSLVDSQMVETSGNQVIIISSFYNTVLADKYLCITKQRVF